MELVKSRRLAALLQLAKSEPQGMTIAEGLDYEFETE